MIVVPLFSVFSLSLPLIFVTNLVENRQPSDKSSKKLRKNNYEHQLLLFYNFQISLLLFSLFSLYFGLVFIENSDEIVPSQWKIGITRTKSLKKNNENSEK